MIISSTDNKKVIEISKLNITKYRKELGIFIVEGLHLVEEAYKNDLLIEIFSIKEINNFNVPVTVVTENVMKKLSNLDTIPSIIGICKAKVEGEIGNHILILDGVQDPGNLGTIIRSAAAFSIDTIILSNDTVDLYNSKVIRATEGMIFNINIKRCDLLEFIPKLKNNKYKIYGTNVEDGKDIKNVEMSSKYAIIVGNEGNGVKKEINDLCDEFIYIKMNSKCESINVGVAASIIMYELKRNYEDQNR